VEQRLIVEPGQDLAVGGALGLAPQDLGARTIAELKCQPLPGGDRVPGSQRAFAAGTFVPDADGCGG
ncbi:MAG: hypothetical protein Q8N44_08320, partial [Rubrivivax sp.]|nr:hypothetical protein [Rubrivivax sp.]